MNRYSVSVQTLLMISTIVVMSACSGGGDSGGGGSDTTPVKRDSTVASASVIAPGAICANGGIQVDTGIDENGNGLLDSDEIDNTEYVCNGLDGQDGADGQDGQDGADGQDGQDGADGQDGKNSLVLITDEPSGNNCTYGGSRIDVGVDTDSNGVLDTIEITATTYLCRSAADVPANGYAVTDGWGEVWDGLSRPAADLATAQTTCNSLGGRLPTATELYRNNKATGLSSSSISATSENEYLWTILPTTAPSFNVVVRLNDGLSSSADVTSAVAYRCVWADTTPASFTADNCNGVPGEGCWSREYNSNIDTRDRLPLDYAAASAECAFYHASLPVTGEAGTLIHQGLPNGSGNFVWTSDPQYWYSGNFGEALIKWNDINSSQWAYGTTFGFLSASSGKHSFRCIGERDTDTLMSPVPTCQNNECFTTTNHRTILIADSSDRGAATQDVAFEVCSLLGGALPSYDEFTDLIHDGLPNGSNSWLWTSNPLYWYNSGYGLGVVKWSGTGTPEWSYASGTGERSTPSLSRPYRCVWHQKVNDYPVCGTTDGLNRVQNSYVCAPSTDGTSNGNANPSGIEVVDSRGNAWDLIQRGAATYDAARSVCQSLGGQLPTPSEIYAVRANQSLEDSIGDENSVSYLWTRIDGYRPNYNIRTRVSDGASAPALKTDSNAYRCIWPSTKGNVLSGRSCYGGCFKADNKLIADSFDRGAVSVNAAIHECQEAGGHLPDLRELQTLIHRGWENGSNVWLWVNESVYWYSGGYGYAVARWSGIGSSSWAYDSTNGSISGEGAYRPYRCVYSNERR